MNRTTALSLFLLLAAALRAQAKHHHHRHHKVEQPAQTTAEKTAQEAGYNDKFSPEEIQEMQSAEDDSDNPLAPKPAYGMYDMRGDHFDILDTPEKMDPDYLAKQNLAMVNKANHLRGSDDDDDDDE